MNQKFDLQVIQTHLIIGGDFNCVLNPKIDTFNVKSKYKTPSFLKLILKKFLLIDIWRKVQKNNIHGATKVYRLHQELIFVLISKPLKNYIIKTDIRPVVNGDHNAVTTTIRLNDTKHGPGFWKFNTSLLTKSDYCEEVRTIIEEAVQEKNNSCMFWWYAWELCKIRVREYSIKYTKSKKTKENYSTFLEEKLQRINEKMWTLNGEKMQETINEYEKTSEELEQIYKQKCKGSIIRSRVKWFEEGEKNSKYFMSLGKRNFYKSTILQLRNDKGKNFSEQQNIRKCVHQFYSNLYRQKERQHDLEGYFVDLHNPELTDELAELCEGQLTEKECQQVISEFAKNKAPVSDGLNIEFYHFLGTEVKCLLVNSLNEGFENNELSNTQRQAIIKLLHKKGDQTNLENFRPISLLNYDYKIAASVLTKRLQKVIPTLISSDQVGYIKGRSLAENIKLIEDIFYYVQNHSDKGLAFLTDFRKAFDCLSWDFLFECLRKFRFKIYFCRWVNTLYTNVKSSVNVNGWLTKQINITRGVRQGCPLSALLFILAAEVLTIKIRNDLEITGITLFDSVEIKILQFADDATFFVKDTTSLKKAIKQIEHFGLFSGLELNKSKSSIVNINGDTIDESIYGIPWTYSDVKILGVHFGENEQNLINLNWKPKISKIENIVRLWKARRLTFFW